MSTRNPQSAAHNPIWRPAITLTLWFIVAFGLIFPLVIWGLAQTIFPHQANGSLIRDARGQVVGSELIGQNFTRPEYFHPRPSAAGSGYDAANSGGTNLGPTSDKLINGVHDPKNPTADFDGIVDLARKYRAENGLTADTPIPADAVTRSASGLDPDISLANARLQASRVAKARGRDVSEVTALISKEADGGRVNVLRLNRALDTDLRG